MLKRILSFCLLVSILVACGQSEQSGTQMLSDSDPSLLVQEGMVAEVTGNENTWHQILVVPNIDKEDIIDKSTVELMEIAHEQDGAYYGLMPTKYGRLEVGTHVLVYWNGDQEDSAPPQREAVSIEIR